MLMKEKCQYCGESQEEFYYPLRHPSRCQQQVEDQRKELEAKVKALELQKREADELIEYLRDKVEVLTGSNKLLDEAVTALYKHRDESDRLNGELKARMLNMCGSEQVDCQLPECSSCAKVCLCGKDEWKDGRRLDAVCPIHDTIRPVGEIECPHCEGGQICTDTVDCNKCGATGKLPGPCPCKKCADKRVEPSPICGSTPEGDPGSGPCKKAPGHGGVCENDQFVWDWKPTPYVRGELPPMGGKASQ